MQNETELAQDNTGEVRKVLRTEVLVVGGGPAGAAAGFWLARLGHDVTVIERKKFPREKTCGDGLTPRAVKELGDMGLGRSAVTVSSLRRSSRNSTWQSTRIEMADSSDLSAVWIRRASART